ncbi:MAG: hypothetical protein ACFFCF_08210 [Promethearchaeota archaeon]
MVNLKPDQRKWWMHFLIVIIGFSLGSCLITLGLFAPIPPNACNTPSITTIFDADITGTLTPSTPNITTHLGQCTQISIYTHNDIPFTLQIIDDNGYLYLSVPNFANNTTNHQYLKITLFFDDYSLLALREATDAPIDLSVTAIYISDVLPCFDYHEFTIRYGLPIIGILTFLLSTYSTYSTYSTLRQHSTLFEET